MALATNLARSVTYADWSAQTVESVLRRRLPTALVVHANELSKGLVSELPGAYAPSVKKVAAALRETSEFAHIYRYCQQRNVWPAPDLSSAIMAPSSPFAKLDLPQLPTVGDLAEWLSQPLSQLSYLADVQNRYENHDEMAVNHYHYHLKKKSAGVRLVEAPKAKLKAGQRRILRGLLDKVPVHDDAFGFVKGRNCLQSARRHVGEEIVLCFDIASFFPSIKASRVFGLFRCLGYPAGVARVLTGLCTNGTPSRVLRHLPANDRMAYRAPHLPQGAPTSPALANLIVHRLDRRLGGLARCLGAHYSRYADDITFSGDQQISRLLLNAVPEILCEEGFRVNLAKTRVQPFHVPQMVTGIGVNRHLNVDRAKFDRLKAIIHACSKPEDDRFHDMAFRAKLLGQIGWVEAVNPSRGHKLRQLLERAWNKRFAS